jgi:Ca2+-binding RTX toxin-like protein
MKAFLNPVAFTDGGTAGKLTAAQGAGAVIRGMVNQRGEAIDEFITEALRNNLVGLPLDLATLNMTRARSEGIAPLNVARRDLYTGTINGAAGNPDLKPYNSWFEYSLKMRHRSSLVNFIAAYGTHPTIVKATTMADKRAAAQLIVNEDPSVPDANDYLMSAGAWAPDAAGHPTTGLDDVDMWIGGLAEAPPLFGGMLGSTFNFVFTRQMEALQDSDRMYYLSRTAGLPLIQEMERTTFSKLIRRNTDAENVPVMAFTRPDYIFDLAAQTNPKGIVDDPNTVYNEKNLDGTSMLVRLPATTPGSPRTIQLTGGGKTENHSTWLGTNGDDYVQSAEGDDSLWGNDGNDHLDGGVGADFIDGGAGNDFLSDPAGFNNIDGGPGNDVIMAGTGTDNLLGGPGVDAIFGASGTKTVSAGTGDDLVLTGTGADDIAGGPGMDWLEGGDGNDLFSGDERAAFALNQGEDDIMIGGKGDDKYLGEGGTDIAVIGEGNDTYVGGLGFDFATYVRDNLPAFGDLSLPPAVAGAVAGAGGGGLANPRDRFSRVEGLSGGPADDHLRGDNTAGCGGGGGGGGAIACAPGVALVKDSLSQDSVDRIADLQNLLLSAGMYNPAGSLPAPPILPGALPPGGAPTVFTGDDILLGGAGSDTIESSGGDDLIDGDAYLDVWLHCTFNDGTVKDVNSLGDVRNDLWSGILTPDNCVAKRAIKYPADTTGTDTVVYHFSMTLATIVQIGDGRTLVTYPTAIGARAALVVPAAGGGGGATQFSTDTILNVEQLQFSDGTITITPPVVGPGGGLDPHPPVGTVTIDNTAPNVGDTLTPTSNVTDADTIVAGTEDFQWETVAVDPVSGALTTNALGNTAPTTAFTNLGTSFVVPPNAQGSPMRVVYSYLDGLGFFGAVASSITAPVGAPVAPPVTPTLTLTVPPLNTPGIVLTATFLDGAGLPIVGATVNFTAGAATFTGLTDGTGTATGSTTLTAAPGGFVTFNASATDPVSGTTITATQQIVATTYPGVTMNPVGQSVLEGGPGTQTPIGATITLDRPAPANMTVTWEAVAGTATAGADFVATTGTAIVPAGASSVDVSTLINGDALVEPDETITFNVTGVTGGVLGAITSATATILDDDLPTLSFGAAPTVTEGVTPDGAANVVTFDLTLDQAPVNAVSVPWQLVPGSAQPGTDYLDASGIAAFAPGHTTAQITVTLVNDTVVEPTEQFSVQLGVATGATMPAPTSQTATILDDDTPVLVAGPAVSVIEGDNGARNQLAFTLQLDRPSIHPVDVTWVAGGGTATAGVDFTGTGGTVTIPAGDTSLVVPVTVIGDIIREADETVPFQITGVTNALVGQVSTTGTILDDDAPQTVSIDSVSTLEGNVGTHMLTFTLTLDRTARRPISVLVRTVGGSARTPSDFASRSTVVSFAPGQQTATFDVPIVGDRIRERNEAFSVRLSRPVNVRILRGTGTGIIVNDD